MATKLPGGSGERVAARFDGPNQSEAALRALQGAGFRADQVAAAVYDPQADGGAVGGGLPAALVPILGAVLGALLGGILGRALLGGTTAILLGALAGAVLGALIALAVARLGAAQAPAPDAARRAGTVTLTVATESAERAQAARAALQKNGGREIAAGDPAR